MNYELRKVANGYVLATMNYGGPVASSDTYVFKDSWELHIFLQRLERPETNTEECAF